MITEPIKSEQTELRKRYKKNHGATVYTTNIFWILVYIGLLIIVFSKFYKSDSPQDLSVFIGEITLIGKGLTDSVNQIITQWQTNDSHQRTNALKDTLKKKGIIPS